MRGGQILNGLILALACGLCWSLPTSRAEEAAVDAGPKTVVLKVSPAKPAYRPLRNNLLLKKLDLQPGNAAPLYLKACLLASDMTRDKEYQQRQEKIEKWLATPPAELPREEVRAALDTYFSTLELVKIAARRERCDWDLPYREQTFYSILLPEVQWLRTLARGMALETRLKIAEGKPEEAIQGLQTGFAMARHIAAAPLLINDLVGVAVAKLMLDQLYELPAMPKSENLYWSITALPDPLIDFRPALDFEGDAIYLLVPQLRDAATAQRSESQWQADLNGLIKSVEVLEPLTKTQTNNAAASKPLELAELAAVMAPRAKAVLRNDGWSDEKINGMSQAQLIVVGTAVGYAHYRDEIYKWQSLPFGQGDAGSADAEKNLLAAARQKNEVMPLASLLLPSITKAQQASVRLERSIAALRVVEALRCYAASHDGKLPERLDEVQELPIPLNPQTGKPFEYTLKDGRATLAAPPQLGASASQSALRFEISMAR